MNYILWSRSARAQLISAIILIIYTYIHTYIHTYIYIYIHTHTHANMYMHTSLHYYADNNNIFLYIQTNRHHRFHSNIFLLTFITHKQKKIISTNIRLKISGIGMTGIEPQNKNKKTVLTERLDQRPRFSLPTLAGRGRCCKEGEEKHGESFPQEQTPGPG